MPVYGDCPLAAARPRRYRTRREGPGSVIPVVPGKVLDRRLVKIKFEAWRYLLVPVKAWHAFWLLMLTCAHVCSLWLTCRRKGRHVRHLALGALLHQRGGDHLRPLPWPQEAAGRRGQRGQDVKQGRERGMGWREREARREGFLERGRAKAGEGTRGACVRRQWQAAA